MAYSLRYYKEITQADGGMVRLEIHKKDSTSAAVEIGAVVQALSLEIQGQQDDIDTPIQKTSLHMTFVDAPDIEDGRKNGFWEEFYTPDALMWKVILKAKDAEETAFRTIWGGYVTPDSFSENLVYRGSVSITARDNIGHMQDFPFDAEGDADGMISLYNLVESGWEKIQSPMSLEWRGVADSTMWLQCDGVSAMFTLMNVAMFKGMDWYKAIETALASYGVVMRYIGNNIVKMSSLRSMPYQGEETIEDLIHIEPRFIAGAQRELVPAVKRIEESVDYELESAPQPLVKASDFSGNTHVLDSTNDLYGYSLTNTEEGKGWFNSKDYAAIYFSPSGYIIEDAENEDVESKMYVVAGVGYNNRAEYSRTILAQDITINVTFGTGLMRKRFTDASGRPSGGYYLVPRLGTIFGISYAVYVIQNGIKMYYNFASGEWMAQASYRTENNESGITEINIPVDLSEYSGSVILGFDFGGIDATIPYVNIASVTFSGASELREKNTVNTLYNADNNVILSRDPEIGPAFDKVALPAFIKNGIFYRNGNEILPARLWSWGSGSEQQIAVWNHLQLLSYYAKPNNLISGTIVNADITRAKAIYVWHGARHILMSGRYNFLTGHIESAVLREFAMYEDMWSEVAGSALPDTEQESKTNVESGASSGGSSSTYTNTTTVNIGSGGGGGAGASYLNDLLDVNVENVLNQSVLYFNGTEWVNRSLATILNPYAKNDDLLSLSTLLASMWTIDGNGNLVTDKNVIIKGDVASGGEGDVTTQGIVGIKVNGRTYKDSDDGIIDGIIDLGTISGGGGISQITSQMVIDALGYTPVRPATLNNFLPKTGGQLTGALQIFDHMIYDDDGTFSIDSMDSISLYAPNDIVISSDEGQLYFNDKPVLTEHQSLAGYQPLITDLATIRSGASLGATAVQPATLNNYATKTALSNGLATKQNTISDLATIRSGASLGASAVQPATLTSALAGYLPLSGGTLNGALTVNGAIAGASTIQSNSIICGTTRLRVNASTSAGIFAFMDARPHSSGSNRSTAHIGSAYGNVWDIANIGGMVAISIYKGSVGIGREFTDAELKAASDGSVGLTVAGNLVVNGDIASA